MRLLLIAFGSRGDVQPLLALGKGLKSAGYEVAIAAGTNFQAWVESSGFRFVSLGIDFQAVVNSDSGRAWLADSSDNPFKETDNMKRVMEEIAPTVSQHLLDAAKDVDVLVSGLPTLGLADAICEKTGKRHITIFLAPTTPGSDGASTMIPYVPRSVNILNRVSGYVNVYFMYWILGGFTNRFRQQLELTPLSYRDFLRRWTQTPIIYGVSPTVMPRSPEWGDNIHVTGFWYYTEGQNWQPSQALCDFLDAGDAPVYLGFGSMANKNPEATIKTMVEALEKAGVRGMIYTGWAGLKAETLPDSIYLLDGAPHDWLFPRMKAIVHHGGAGTTAAALRAGIPNTIVAHMGDQPYWGRRVYELGAGANWMRRHQFSTDRLAKAIDEMINSPQIKQRAAELGWQMRQEDGVTRAVEAFNTICAVK